MRKCSSHVASLRLIVGEAHWIDVCSIDKHDCLLSELLCSV